MAPERKEDIVCAFHEDLENILKEIRAEIKDLQRWRYKTVGFSAAVSTIIGLFLVPVLKALKVI